MGRHASYPKTINDCSFISITKLKEWGYLQSGSKSGVITWSRNGNKTGSISIEMVFTHYQKYLIVDYKCDGEPKRYKIEIEEFPSNLGKGSVYYFLCPQTNKNCRKLYLHGDLFLHRSAFGLMYENQIESKKNRELLKVFNMAFLSDEVYEERFKKYFKTHYKGKPTKKYLLLENKIKISETYPPNLFETLVMM